LWFTTTKTHLWINEKEERIKKNKKKEVKNKTIACFCAPEMSRFL
jgi:hypothetical protein